jgi:hypothetical protein
VDAPAYDVDIVALGASAQEPDPQLWCIRGVGARPFAFAALTSAALLVSAVPANAKQPPWTCELSTTRPFVGEPVRVVVRYWNDPAHTEPASWGFLPDRIDDFPEVLGDLPNGRGHSQMWGTLRRVRPAVYVGSLTFEDTLRYRVLRCSAPFRSGYPRGSIVVRPIARPRPPETASDGLTEAHELLVIATIVGFGGAYLLRTLTRPPAVERMRDTSPDGS